MTLFWAGFAGAQRHQTFAERPARRQAAAERARKRATREKRDARAWAKARGLPVRRVDGRQVRELMAIRNGRPVYYATKNKNAAISTAADRVRNTAPYGVDGSGVTVGVWDGGSVLTTHQEFGTRVENKDGVESEYHATHVGGTIGAVGVTDKAKGMAPNVGIDSYDWDGDVSEMTEQAASAPGQTDKLYLSNHSYGYLCGWEPDGIDSYVWHGGSWTASAEEDAFGRYVSEAREWDEIVYNAPYFLPFKAAGNDRSDTPQEGDSVRNGEGGAVETYDLAKHPKGDGVYDHNGYDTLNPVSSAKNIMTVGAVEDAVAGGVRSLEYAAMISFSSWGPADDGRIKPDIVANGDALYSCSDSSDSSYGTSSGSSMATPNACGSAALLVDYYDNLFPGQAMRASTLKGLIIHTADDLGRPGPDYSFGWGLMNTQAAADLLADFVSNPMRLHEEKLSGGNQSDRYSFFCDGLEPVRVTLCWTDPPGASTTLHDNRTPRLVNDLDLKVVDPRGTTLYPFKLDYANPAADATTSGKNNIDNVEQVYVEVPVAGVYTITVDYDGNLSGGEQGYSLLVSGTSADADSDGLPDWWESTYFADPVVALATADPDGDGADNLTEYISGYDPTNPASVFQIVEFEAPTIGNAPFILTWNSVEGRTYDVLWSDDLVYSSFKPLGENLPYTQSSYTDTVERTGPQNFYRVDVRLGE